MPNEASSEILNPGKEALDFPSFLIATQLSAVLSGLFAAVASMGSDELQVIIVEQIFVQRVTIISSISNELFDGLQSKSGVESLMD